MKDPYESVRRNGVPDYLTIAKYDIEPKWDPPDTLADWLACATQSAWRAELEAFRVRYEAEHGRTDITRVYVSQRPLDKQQWLLEKHPAHYFDALPPYMQEYCRQKADQAARTGRTDDLPPLIRRLHVTGVMREEQRGRGR